MSAAIPLEISVHRTSAVDRDGRLVVTTEGRARFAMSLRDPGAWLHSEFPPPAGLTRSHVGISEEVLAPSFGFTLTDREVVK